jgi:CRISPR-associated protein Csc3
MSEQHEPREQHEAVKRLAEFAAANYIWGRSSKRTSLLDPFARILEQLERFPDPRDRDLLRASLKSDISRHIELASRYGVSAERKQAIYQYVDLFFDEVLQREHHDRVQNLLDRSRLLKGAYLLFLRDALPQSLRKAADSESDEPGDEDEAVS